MKTEANTHIITETGKHKHTHTYKRHTHKCAHTHTHILIQTHTHVPHEYVVGCTVLFHSRMRPFIIDLP